MAVNPLGTPEEIKARQAELRANISSATGAQFDAQGNNTRPADSWFKLNGQAPPPATTATAPAPAAPSVGYQSSYMGPDIAGMTDKLNQGIELRKQAELDAIRRERETALQGYNKMETQTKTQAYDNRNSADVVSMQNAQRLRQSMADMGLINSGDNITAQSQGNAQRQGAIGSINRDESQSLTDIGERRNLTVNQAAGAERSLTAELEAERLNRMIALQQYGDQAMREWDNTQYGRSRDTIGDTRYTDETAYNRGRDTIGDTRYADETKYNRGIDQRNFDFQKEQQDWSNNFQTGQFNWQKAQQTWENAFKVKDFEQSMRDAAASRGLQWASLNQRERETIADQAWREKTFNYQKEQDALKNSPQAGTAEDYYSYIDSSPSAFTKDKDGMAIQNNSIVESMILNSGLSPSEMTKLYRRYGIPMK